MQNFSAGKGQINEIGRFISHVFSRKLHNYRGVATGEKVGGGGDIALSLQFSNQARSNSFSFKHQRYCFLRVFRNYADRKSNNFYRVCYNFWTTYGVVFIFSNYIREKITPRWTFWKSSILTAEPSGKLLIVDHPKENHNEQEFKRQIIGGILDLLKKSAKTIEAFI